MDIGLSYSEDEKEVVSNVIIDDEFAAIPFILNPATAALAGFQFFPPFFNYPNANEDGKWNSDDVTHSVKLIHEFDDSLSAYISHSTGFKAISTNLGANATVYAGQSMDPSIYFAQPEEAENIEVGFKKTFSNGYLNMSFFHMAVEGYQSNLFIGTGFNLVNIGEQTNKGIEIDSLFFLNENFVVTFAASYIDELRQQPKAQRQGYLTHYQIHEFEMYFALQIVSDLFVRMELNSVNPREGLEVLDKEKNGYQLV